MKIAPITSNMTVCTKKNNNINTTFKVNKPIGDTVSFGGKLIILATPQQDFSEIICGEKRDDLFGSWFKIFNSKLNNVSIQEAMGKHKQCYSEDTSIIGSNVSGDIQADGPNSLILARTRVKGDISSSEARKKLVVETKSVLEKDILLDSKGYMKIIVDDRSVVEGNIICKNSSGLCEKPEVHINNKSKVKKDIEMRSDNAKIYIDKGIVKNICFDFLTQQSKQGNPLVDIKNTGVVEGDICFYSKKGTIVIEEGSKVKGNIYNANVIYTDKQGKVIKEEDHGI